MEDMACLEGRCHGQEEHVEAVGHGHGHVEHVEAGHGCMEPVEAVGHSSWLAGLVGGVAGEEGNEVADKAWLLTLVVAFAGRRRVHE